MPDGWWNTKALSATRVAGTLFRGGEGEVRGSGGLKHMFVTLSQGRACTR